MPCELQVALKRAVQVTFQLVAGDLCGHDADPGDDSGAVLLLLTSGANDNAQRGPHRIAKSKDAWPTSWPQLRAALRWPLTLSRISLPARRLDQQKNPG